MKPNHPILGVLGGLGPMSTFYFCELLTTHTKAESDSDHIDMLISSRATTPDRTAFIIGKSNENPLPVMREEAMRLVLSGASQIVIPCNTAHYFFDQLQETCPIPILNIASEAVRYLHDSGIRKFGLLATEGTVSSGTYCRYSDPYGMDCITPDEDGQKTITSVIYDYVKQNRQPDTSVILPVIRNLIDQGSEAIVLGCTELSVIRGLLPKELPICDSLEILAYRTILSCGKTPVGFDPALMSWRANE